MPHTKTGHTSYDTDEATGVADGTATGLASGKTKARFNCRYRLYQRIYEWLRSWSTAYNTENTAGTKAGSADGLAGKAQLILPVNHRVIKTIATICHSSYKLIPIIKPVKPQVRLMVQPIRLLIY